MTNTDDTRPATEDAEAVLVFAPPRVLAYLRSFDTVTIVPVSEIASRWRASAGDEPATTGYALGCQDTLRACSRDVEDASLWSAL